MERIRPLRMFEPTSLIEAMELLSAHAPHSRILAGGTDVVVQLRRLGTHDAVLVNLKHIPELTGVRQLPNGWLQIGALTTVSELESPHGPALAALTEACHVLGPRSVRNLATIGGNICRASPASDLCSPLIVLGARLVIAGKEGERCMPVEHFFKAPGKNALLPDEILTAIHLPPQEFSCGAYRKSGRTCGSDCAQAGAAVLVQLEAGTIARARICLTAVGPTPLRATAAETLLCGHAPTPERLRNVADRAAEEARPITDFRASAAYRRDLIRTLVVDALRAATSR